MKTIYFSQKSHCWQLCCLSCSKTQDKEESRLKRVHRWTVAAVSSSRINLKTVVVSADGQISTGPSSSHLFFRWTFFSLLSLFIHSVYKKKSDTRRRQRRRRVVVISPTREVISAYWPAAAADGGGEEVMEVMWCDVNYLTVIITVRVKLMSSWKGDNNTHWVKGDAVVTSNDNQ